MLSLVNSDRFKNDVKKYKEEISQVTDVAYKKLLENYLDKLITQAKSIDNHHSQMMFTKQISTMGDDVRSRIVDIRKTLDSKIKDWKLANPK